MTKVDAAAWDLDEAARGLARVDARMAALIAEVGPPAMVLRSGHDVFATLARSIIFQQLATAAAVAIHGRFVALGATEAGPSAADVAALADTELRARGLSQSKVLALRDLARHVLEGALPSIEEMQALDEEEVIARLVKVRGIGRWSAQIFLIFRLGKPDVLPENDYGVRKGYAYTYRKRALPSPAALAKLAQRFSPYRSLASWYFWRAADLANHKRVRFQPVKKATTKKAATKKVVRAARVSKKRAVPSKRTPSQAGPRKRR